MPRDTFFCTSPLCSTSTDFPCCPNNPLASRFFLCCQLPTACTTSTWKRHVQCARWIGRQNSTKSNYLLLVSISPHLSCTPKWKSKLMILMPQKMQTSSFPCIIYQECSKRMMRQPLLCTFPFPLLHLEQYFFCKWKQDVILCLPCPVAHGIIVLFGTVKPCASPVKNGHLEWTNMKNAKATKH